MEARESSSSGAFMPSLEVVDSLKHPSTEGREQTQKVENAPLNGVLVEAATALEDDKVSRDAEERSSPAPVSVEVKTFENSTGKRKRGRPPKGLPKLPPPVKKKKDEEDVCFICYDGGSLVLCDRRGCPKAYHPACVQRDDAFFQLNARWDCGWHLCSTCQKSAHYMCYTCTYSLCKACTWGADYVYVRENKGFCSMCMRTIMLIENKDRREKETVVVDFDDKSSWEYLFKMYWFYLKEKLSLTLDELMKAKSRCKADGDTVYKGKYMDDVSCKNGLKHPILGIPPESKEMEIFNGSKLSNRHTTLLSDNVSPTKNKLSSDEGAPVAASAKWASKELLAFVAYVKNGDMSKLSIQEAQALLLDYVKGNNLQDPSQKSQIICDARLVKLFGKPRVGHIEMLKLLQFHYPIKDESPEDVSKRNIYPAVASQADGKAHNCNVLVMAKEKKSRTLEMAPDERSLAYLNEYAAIDVHNINLIYLRRCSLENLIDKSGKLHDNILDSFVRISVSGDDHEPDICRLVQVVGTCKVGTPYKIGENTVDVALEILNLDKKEVISISAISNQEFSENECRRLRESIKCGLVKHLTVGQILEKSKSLREIIVNDWLEREVLRLNQLRDEANEKGQEKELREFVEKIEIMKTPEERQRRLSDVPEVHVDPTMKAKNRSVEAIGLFDDKNQAVYGKTKVSGLKRNEREAISSKGNNMSYETRSKKLKGVPNNIDIKENKLTTSDSTKASNGDKRVETVVGDSNSLATSLFQPKPQIEVTASSAVVTSMPFSGIAPKASVTSLSTGIGSSTVVTSMPFSGTAPKTSVTSLSTGTALSAAVTSMPFSGIAPEASVTSVSTGTASSLHNNENENSWHYRDPDGNIQGPFCLLMLRKWSISGYFPSDLRIWSMHDMEGNSLLLIDVLKGQQPNNKQTSLQHNLNLPVQKVQVVKENAPSYWNGGSNSNLPLASLDDKQSVSCQDKLVQGAGSGLTPAFNCIDINKTGSPCLESVKVNDLCSKQTETSLPQECSNDGNQMARETNQGNQSNDQGYSSYSSWRSPPFVVPPHKLDLNTSFSFEAKSNLAQSEIKSGNDIYSDASTKDRQSSESFTVHIQGSQLQNAPNPTLNLDYIDKKSIPKTQGIACCKEKQSDQEKKFQASDKKQSLSLSSNFINRDDSVPSWSSSSGLFLGGSVPPRSNEWMGHSPAATAASKASVEELGLGLISVPQMKPPEPTHSYGANNITISQTHPASGWLAMVSEPIELSTLAEEESVSDLLAEVDAMEFQGGGGLPSPTSAMNYVDYLFEDTVNDCFHPTGTLNRTLDTTKNSDVQPIMINESIGTLHSEKRRSQGQSSSHNWQRDSSASNNRIPESSSSTTSSTTSHDMVVDRDGMRRPWSTSLGWEGAAATHENGNMHRSSVGSGGYSDSSGRYSTGEERLNDHRELWSRHSTVGGGSSSSDYFRTPAHPQKGPGQRVCKLYESGRCKKGAYCEHLHR
ncbi:zinc finger CCCH domain-containing protein 44-like [Impatiens glandulifera]|uniref:zinc finger CCCH domain-containing protein 44-like n=1 Tax=Impatiens glandulifera TaxID=253017 RepID=UPI001FB174FF|nr:zinc finger CCCH domain-containing protein 44-like [Impatiens glandulifera]